MKFINALLKVFHILDENGNPKAVSGTTADGTKFENVTDLNRAQYLAANGFPWLEKLLSAIESIVGPILIVVGAIGVIYAIYLGVMLAKAENAEKREEAKKRIVNVLIAIAITAVLIFIMYLFSANVDWFMGLNSQAS